MNERADWVSAFSCVGLFGSFLACGGSAEAQKFTVLVSGLPAAPSQLTLDAGGNFLATGYKTVFKFLAKTGYTTYRSEYTLPAESTSALTLTAHNIILGMVDSGAEYTDGAVFTLGRETAPSLSYLHQFSYMANPAQPNDGWLPAGGVVPGLFNRYYGTTVAGGFKFTSGVIFAIGSSPSRPYYEIIHRFEKTNDVLTPSGGGLVADAHGNLFGVALDGGTYGTGGIFEVQYNSGWQEKVIHSFGGPGDLTGAMNYATLSIDSAGDLYGCAAGGSTGEGGVYELAPPTVPTGSWSEAELYQFGTQSGDGVVGPYGGNGGCNVSVDPDSGRIVGVNATYGKNNGGTLFTLTPPAGSKQVWSEQVWHAFGKNKNSSGPLWPPVLVNGVYYGSSGGGLYSYTP